MCSLKKQEAFGRLHVASHIVSQQNGGLETVTGVGGIGLCAHLRASGNVSYSVGEIHSWSVHASDPADQKKWHHLLLLLSVSLTGQATHQGFFLAVIIL